MSLPKYERHNFVPTASIVALVFIGVLLLICLIGRCYALHQSTMHSSQNLDLVIYRAPPKSNIAISKVRTSIDIQNELNDNREHRTSFDDPVIPIPVQRGPKNL